MPLITDEPTRKKAPSASYHFVNVTGDLSSVRQSCELSVVNASCRLAPASVIRPINVNANLSRFDIKQNWTMVFAIPEESIENSWRTC